MYLALAELRRCLRRQRAPPPAASASARAWRRSCLLGLLGGGLAAASGDACMPASAMRARTMKQKYYAELQLWQQKYLDVKPQPQLVTTSRNHNRSAETKAWATSILSVMLEHQSLSPMP
jgi:hypothetical protein